MAALDPAERGHHPPGCQMILFLDRNYFSPKVRVRITGILWSAILSPSAESGP
jgi:hypothetical protein